MSVVEKLKKFRNVHLEVCGDKTPDADGTAAIRIAFSDGTKLQVQYWRFVQNGRAKLSSFDHQQKYGLPAAIDAKEQITDLLTGAICGSVKFDGETGDLTLVFSEATYLQVFNFTGYEIWTLRFPDGSAEYSNHAQSH